MRKTENILNRVRASYVRLNHLFLPLSHALKHQQPPDSSAKSTVRDQCRCGCGCRRKGAIAKGLYGEVYQLSFCRQCEETHQKKGKFRTVPLRDPKGQAI